MREILSFMNKANKNKIDHLNKKRTFRIFTLSLFFCGIFFLSKCSEKEEEAGELALNFSLNRSYILPGEASSCKQILAGQGGADESKDIRSPRIQYKGITIDWKRDAELTVVAIVLEFKNPKLEGDFYTCSINGDDLHALFGQDPNYNQGIIPRAAKVTSNDSCYLHCGGAQLKNKNPVARSISIQGTARIIGYSTEESLSVPIQSSTSVLIEY